MDHGGTISPGSIRSRTSRLRSSKSPLRNKPGSPHECTNLLWPDLGAGPQRSQCTTLPRACNTAGSSDQEHCPATKVFRDTIQPLLELCRGMNVLESSVEAAQTARDVGQGLASFRYDVKLLLTPLAPLTSASGAGSWRGPSPDRHRGRARPALRPARRDAHRQAMGVAGTPSA
jgi:hypothetical protein